MTPQEYNTKLYELIPQIISGLLCTEEFLELVMSYSAEHGWNVDSFLDVYAETKTNNRLFIENLKPIFIEAEKEFKKQLK